MGFNPIPFRCFIYTLKIFGILLFCWCFGFLVFSLMSLKLTADRSIHVTDGIVVFTGSSGRIELGLKLFKDGLGKKLFISGVHKGVKAEILAKKQSVSDDLRSYLKDQQLGYEAQNTKENVKETLEWIEKNKIKSIRLVTADYHVFRSLLEFRLHRPTLEIIVHPVRIVTYNDWMPLKILWREYMKLTARLFGVLNDLTPIIIDFKTLENFKKGIFS